MLKPDPFNALVDLPVHIDPQRNGQRHDLRACHRLSVLVHHDAGEDRPRVGPARNHPQPDERGQLALALEPGAVAVFASR